MRIAIVSDIHGNRTAFDAVLQDLRKTSPDVTFHGGDLADGGSSPLEIVDHVRDLGWRGVFGNSDEMLFRPGSLSDFARGAPQLRPMFDKIAEMANWTRQRLGEDRVAWLGALPMVLDVMPLALVHANPSTAWKAPGAEATDDELEAAFAPLDRELVVYGHIHRSFVRRLGERTVVNTGSVSLSHDGDPRASYLVIDDGEASIRRVEYDVQRELKALEELKDYPHADWIARILAAARPQMP